MGYWRLNYKKLWWSDNVGTRRGEGRVISEIDAKAGTENKLSS